MNNNKGTSSNGVLGGLSKGLALASTATILLMMVIIAVGFTFRALRLSFSGVNEGTEFLVLIGIFLGFAFVQHKKTHIKMDLLTSFFPVWLKVFVSLLGNLMALIFFSAILYGGLISVFESYQIGEYEVGLRSVPVWLVRTFIPIGSLAVILVSLGDLFQIVTDIIQKDRNALKKM